MGSPKKPQSPEPTSWKADDPLGLVDAFYDDCERSPPEPPATAPTGLSEEEDAARHLALRFNPNMRICVNCEQIYDNIYICQRCDLPLRPIGAKVLRYKVS